LVIVSIDVSILSSVFRVFFILLMRPSNQAAI